MGTQWTCLLVSQRWEELSTRPECCNSARWGQSPLGEHLFFKILCIYLREREHEQKVGRERGRSRLLTEQGAWRGAPSQDPGIMTWAEGRHLTKWATQALLLFFLIILSLTWNHLKFLFSPAWVYLSCVSVCVFSLSLFRIWKVLIFHRDNEYSVLFSSGFSLWFDKNKTYDLFIKCSCKMNFLIYLSGI